MLKRRHGCRRSRADGNPKEPRNHSEELVLEQMWARKWMKERS